MQACYLQYNVDASCHVKVYTMMIHKHIKKRTKYMHSYHQNTSVIIMMQVKLDCKILHNILL